MPMGSPLGRGSRLALCRSIVAVTLSAAVIQCDVDLGSRPAAPDPTKISATKATLGLARVTAPAGTFAAKVGVELFSYALAPGAPGFSLAQATAEGALDAMVSAVPGDLVAVRIRQVGVASEAKLVDVRE